MNSFNDFFKVANNWAIWAEYMCDYFKDECGSCAGCPCTKAGDDDGRCLLNFSTWLGSIQYNEWAEKFMETCDRLTAENEELKRNIARLEHKDIENRILREKLTQEVLTNLEMQIVLDTQEFYREANRDADFCF